MFILKTTYRVVVSRETQEFFIKAEKTDKKARFVHVMKRGEYVKTDVSRFKRS